MPERQRKQKVQGICSWLWQIHGRVLTFAHQASSEKGEKEREGETGGETERGRTEKGSSYMEFTLHWLQRGTAAEEHLCEKGTSFKTAAFLKHTHTHTYTLNPPQSSSPSYPLDLKIAAALSPRRGFTLLNQTRSVKGVGAHHPFICLSAYVCTKGTLSWWVTKLALLVTSVSRNGEKASDLPKQRHRGRIGKK